jgi:hypothetical protein
LDGADRMEDLFAVLVMLSCPYIEWIITNAAPKIFEGHTQRGNFRLARRPRRGCDMLFIEIANG